MAVWFWRVVVAKDASVSLSASVENKFPKTSRLLKKKDFRFRPYQRFQTKYFQLVYTKNGRGRIGISIAKKVLRRSVWRNRIRRLLREAFRLQKKDFASIDVHVIAQPALLAGWDKLKRQDIEAELQGLVMKIEKGKEPS